MKRWRFRYLIGVVATTIFIIYKLLSSIVPGLLCDIFIFFAISAFLAIIASVVEDR